MYIDGDDAPFATYDNGPHEELLPLACDGKQHSYRLVARAGGAMSTASITVTTKTS
jgi:hypothetical protein